MTDELKTPAPAPESTARCVLGISDCTAHYHFKENTAGIKNIRRSIATLRSAINYHLSDAVLPTKFSDEKRAQLDYLVKAVRRSMAAAYAEAKAVDGLTLKLEKWESGKSEYIVDERSLKSLFDIYFTDVDFGVVDGREVLNAVDSIFSRFYPSFLTAAEKPIRVANDHAVAATIVVATFLEHFATWYPQINDAYRLKPVVKRSITAINAVKFKKAAREKKAAIRTAKVMAKAAKLRAERGLPEDAGPWKQSEIVSAIFGGEE